MQAKNIVSGYALFQLVTYEKSWYIVRLTNIHLPLKYAKYNCFLFRYSKDDPFIALTIDIRNHQNLVESLDQFVKGDLLEGANAYHCDKCNKKVAMRLFMHLSRLKISGCSIQSGVY